MNLFNIEQIVCKVRQDFEDGIIDEMELKQLYLQYNSLNDINSFIKKAKKYFPHLNCGLASVYLKKLFPEGMIVNGKFKHNNHTFLLLKNSIVVDITSDQYGGPKVYIGSLQYPWSLNLKKINKYD